MSDDTHDLFKHEIICDEIKVNVLSAAELFEFVDFHLGVDKYDHRHFGVFLDNRFLHLRPVGIIIFGEYIINL